MDLGKPSNRSTGQALIAVLIAALIIGFALAITVLNVHRSATSGQQENEAQKFKEFTERMKRIFESVALCTCNLRGVQTNVPNSSGPGGRAVLLTPNLANIRTAFGFYDLTSDTSAANYPCVTGLNSPPADIVLHLLDSAVSTPYPKAMQVSAVRIEDFFQQSSVPDATGATKWKAQFKFVTSKPNQMSRSNQNDPVSMDVYLKVIPGPGGESEIRECYSANVSSPSPGLPPLSAPTPSPNPSPSSSPTPLPSSSSSCPFAAGDDFDTTGGFSQHVTDCCATDTSPPTPPMVCCTFVVLDPIAKVCKCSSKHLNGQCP